MKNIIIVGTGKAAYLHHLKYKKLGYQNIYFLDNKITKTYIDSTNIFYSIDSLLSTNIFEPEYTVVDICTPCSIFMDIIDDFISKGMINFIVEKPFIVPDNYFDDKEGIKFIMMENYKYSLITNDIIKFLKSQNVNIKKIRIDFSKDRINESMSKRGISSDNIPTNFEIEMPHEIYLADYLVDNGVKHYHTIYLENMKRGDVTLPKHGYGLIKYVRNDVEIVLESNLMKNPNRRFIEIEFDGGFIRANYIIYDGLFNKKNDGVIEITTGSDKKTLYYDLDDNMYYSLKRYLYDLDKGLNISTYKSEILNFSQTLNYVIKNEGLEINGKSR